MQEVASEEQIQMVIERLVNMGFEVHRSTGATQTVLGAVGARHEFDIRDIEVLSGVSDVHRVSSPYKLVARSWRPEGTIVRFRNGVSIGGDEIVIMAGPCSVESDEQISAIAETVSKSGGKFLRGGAFKPRSSPYSFQGMGEDALKLRQIWAVGGQRGHGNLADPTHAALCGYVPGGCSQHAELQPVAGVGQSPQAGAVEAGNFRYH